jgi:hypothetical protein
MAIAHGLRQSGDLDLDRSAKATSEMRHAFILSNSDSMGAPLDESTIEAIDALPA